MTEERMAHQALLEKTPDTDFLRRMIGFAAQRLMELDIESRTGAAHGERSAERIVQRNGYRDRDGGDMGGNGRTAHPETAQGQLFPELPGTAADGGKGHRGSRPRGLRAGRLDPLGR